MQKKVGLVAKEQLGWKRVKFFPPCKLQWVRAPKDGDVCYDASREMVIWRGEKSL